VAEYIASLVREGNTGRALFDLDQVPFNLQSEAWLVEQAARRQLGSPTASVRWSDIQLLGALLSTSAGSLAELDKMVLIEMDQQVLAAAVTLFAKRKQAPSKESLVHAGTIVNEAEYQTLCRVATYLPGQAGEVLGQFCNSDKPALVLVAAGCVPAVGPSCESGTPGLVRLLDSKYEVDRSRACEALGAIGPGARAALPALRLAARGDPDGVVRWHACEALVSIGRVEPALVAGALGDALSDEFRAIRIEAAKGLATFGKGAAPASEQLRAALKDRDEDVVRWAQNALEALGDK
jgi:hypothetical protein